ncbi:type III PLP-dependent enzyme [Terricaulis silvestris]|uniref:ornithine decarboxylase n=1 Tax=Terricaulis silvestris TaxID=2686094 RepID=A0A6I6MLX4_9CAUL|nr:type III PLP-dependent enzyme [Terricaulis silvestris]QGZ96455.1 Lysine/ornithine decarboxylase [Terricaulis silvestris]
MDSVLSPLDLTAREAPDGPVAIARPHRVRAAATWFRENFPGEVFYAVKANPSEWVLDALWEAGIRGFDVASDVEAALIANKFKDAQIAFMHPVKSRRAIGRAFHDYGVKTFALDSEDELDKILAETGFAKDLTLVVRFAVPGDGAAYPLTRKFGVSPEEAPALLRKTRQASEEMLGVSFHVGSQCMKPDAYRTAMDGVNRAIVNAGVVVDIVDVGGGFPAIYPGMSPRPMIEYVNAIKNGFEEMFVAQNAKLWAEPGRALVAEAGSTVTRVELRKGDALYLNDGAFGTLFDATHLNWAFPAKLLRQTPSRAKLAPFRLYGPTCDSMDAAAGPFMLPTDIQEGDLIEIGSLGAYGTAMGTRFNGFGETVTMESNDSPWPSMYGEASSVVALPKRKRAPRKPKQA